MNGAALLRDSRQNVQTKMNRLLSPQGFGYRPSQRLVDSLYSPQPSPKNDSFLPNTSDFINELQQNLKRLSPDFSFKYSTESPLFQTLSYVSQAVDGVLEERSKHSKSLEASQRPNDVSEEEITMTIKQELEKAKETTKNLNRYELLLKKKEERIEAEKHKIHTEKKKIKILEEELQELKESLDSREADWVQTKKAEHERINDKKAETEMMMIEAKDLKERLEKKMEEATKHIQYEKNNLIQLEALLNDAKLTLNHEQKKLSLDKLELEKEKWRIEQKERKVEETEKLVNLKLERLEKETQEFEEDKKRFMEIRSKVEEEKLKLTNLQEKRRVIEAEIKETNTKLPHDSFFLERQYDYPKANDSEFDLKAKELEEREQEIEQAYKELQDRVESFNRDLEDRDLQSEEKEMVLNRIEKDLHLKIENLRRVESILTESKIELEELKGFTIPDLESQSEALESLTKDLLLKKNELEILTLRLNKEIDYVQKQFKRSDSSISNKIYEKPDVHSEEIQAVAVELEVRVKAFKLREEELEKEEERLMKEKEQMMQTAEFLKKAHMDMEQSKIKIEKDNIEEKERIKKQLSKLETGMRLLSTKEAEVQAFKKKIEEKEKMLKTKEASLAYDEDE